MLWLSFFTLSLVNTLRSSSPSGSSFTMKSNMLAEFALPPLAGNLSGTVTGLSRVQRHLMSGTLASPAASWERSSSRKSSHTCTAALSPLAHNRIETQWTGTRPVLAVAFV